MGQEPAQVKFVRIVTTDTVLPRILRIEGWPREGSKYSNDFIATDGRTYSSYRMSDTLVAARRTMIKQYKAHFLADMANVWRNIKAGVYSLRMMVMCCFLKPQEVSDLREFFNYYREGGL